MRGSRGWGQWVWTSPHQTKSQNVGFPSHTGPDTLKITKLPSQHSMLANHRHASETPFQWRFTGRAMMTAYSDIWIIPLLHHQLKERCQMGPPLTKISGSGHVLQFIRWLADKVCAIDMFTVKIHVEWFMDKPNAICTIDPKTLA